jgi:hypothetical protein
MSVSDLEATGVHRMVREDLLAEVAKANGDESAERVYRAIPALRDLPPVVQHQLAVALEWAREGITRQQGEISPDLEALHAAYGHARDALLAALRRKPAAK